MSDLIARVEDRAGRITLNRPDALNALTHEMALEMERVLRAWAEDPAVALVIVDATGDRAFCAGGDIQKLYETGRAGDFAYGQRFWADEYRLNALIAGYAKPYVAAMQGFVMGGGVGISAHGSHRIVTETTQVAMPECGIGLIPDVGGSHLLAQAPGHLGAYLGLTGTRMGPADAILAGFADHFVPAARLASVLEEAAEAGDPAAIVMAAADPPPGELAARREAVDAAFASGDAAAILAQLPEADWAGAAAKAIRRGSPLSIACALHTIRAAQREPGVAAALRREYRFVARCMEYGDFLEGIRAAVIDKDRSPQWSAASVEGLTPDRVSAMLAPLPDGDLALG
ncbi:MAG: enoyl-CoA hydratase/isomerase family protein [Pseudomonadota bacterium]